MRLTWKDGLATLFVGAAAVIYALWQTEAGMTGISTRALGAAVFALGWAGCVSNAASMAVVYGVAPGRQRPPLVYVVTVSFLGAVALAAGIITMVGSNEATLATLVGALVALWAMSTVRHAAVPA